MRNIKNIKFAEHLFFLSFEYSLLWLYFYFNIWYVSNVVNFPREVLFGKKWLFIKLLNYYTTICGRVLVLKSFYKLISIMLAFCLVFSTFGPINADANTTEPLASEDEQFEMLEELLMAIDNVPDEVIQGNNQIVIMTWIKNNVENTTLKSNLGLAINKFRNQGKVTTHGGVGCAGAILAAIGSNLFAPLKITKIKAVINAAGGVTKFVQKIKSAYDSYRKLGYKRQLALNRAIDAAAGEASADVKSAIQDLFGITSILAACGLDT